MLPDRQACLGINENEGRFVAEENVSKLMHEVAVLSCLRMSGVVHDESGSLAGDRDGRPAVSVLPRQTTNHIWR